MGDAQVIPLPGFGSRYSLIPGSPPRKVTRPGPKTISPVGRSNLGVLEWNTICFGVDEVSGIRVAHGAKEIKARLCRRNRHLVSKFLEKQKKERIVRNRAV